MSDPHPARGVERGIFVSRCVRCGAVVGPHQRARGITYECSSCHTPHDDEHRRADGRRQ